MTTTTNQADERINPAARLGLQSGDVVQELGAGADVDQELREAIAEVTGQGLVDEAYGDTADTVVLWFRDTDGDLADALTEALGSLADGGVVWLFTPASGRDGCVEPSEIGEAGPNAGLAQTSSLGVSPDWTGTRFVAPRARKR